MRPSESVSCPDPLGARQELSIPAEDFLPVAFDPLPQLSPHPIGLDAVRAWIQDHLVEYGKDPAELPWT